MSRARCAYGARPRPRRGAEVPRAAWFRRAQRRGVMRSLRAPHPARMGPRPRRRACCLMPQNPLARALVPWGGARAHAAARRLAHESPQSAHAMRRQAAAAPAPDSLPQPPRATPLLPQIWTIHSQQQLQAAITKHADTLSVLMCKSKTCRPCKGARPRRAAARTASARRRRASSPARRRSAPRLGGIAAGRPRQCEQAAPPAERPQAPSRSPAQAPTAPTPNPPLLARRPRTSQCS